MSPPTKYLAKRYSSWPESILICWQMLVELGSYAIQHHIDEHLWENQAQANSKVVTI